MAIVGTQQAPQNWDQYQEQLAQQNLQLQQQNAQLASKYAGRPDRPEFTSMIDSETGLLGPQYQLGGELNTGALDRMRQDASRDPGQASMWRQLQQQKLEGQAGQAAAGAQAQTQNAMSNLAMRGGLRSGTAERLAGQGAQRAAQAQQKVLGQGLNLDVADEQNRLQQLGAVNQANLQQAQFQRAGDQFNIQGALNETLQRRAADINAFNEEMRAWAAERTAQATPSGGGGKK